MDDLEMKGAGQRSLSSDEKAELGKLKSKYADLRKKRAAKINRKPQQGG